MAFSTALLRPMVAEGWLGPAGVAALMPVCGAAAVLATEAWAALVALDQPCRLDRLVVGPRGQEHRARLVEAAVLALLPAQCWDVLDDEALAALPRHWDRLLWRERGATTLPGSTPLIGGSWALHRYLSTREAPPAWTPNDVDVWFPNRACVWPLASLYSLRLATQLGLRATVVPYRHPGSTGYGGAMGWTGLVRELGTHLNLALEQVRRHFQVFQIAPNVADMAGPEMDPPPPSSREVYQNVTRWDDPVPASHLRGTRCAVMQVVDIYYSPGCAAHLLRDRLVGELPPLTGTIAARVKQHLLDLARRLLPGLRNVPEASEIRKVSFIGVVPAKAGARYTDHARGQLPPLTSAEVLGRFDLDICRVGLEVPVGGPLEAWVFHDYGGFTEAVRTRRTQQVVPLGCEYRAGRRAEKYRARGYEVEQVREVTP